ncbi:MAG: 4-hydroxythreonine-4-phosphate dehydrogenase PdxA [Omnitrophica bacterium RBG_13_46_9]|nr:MAG: 4-hydroxythreonine-4-phosphate dehydrogenase PdxA [Omnitrophica bacterium RBG_13_46_9]
MPISHLGKKVVVITGGDPSGIGPEIILKSLAKNSLAGKIIPIVIGDYRVFRKTALILKMDLHSVSCHRPGSLDITADGINFIDLGNVPLKNFKFGCVNKAYGRASMEYLICGVSLAENLKDAALVTAPINKYSINKAGFKFAGHTEFLSHITKRRNVTMMLVGGGLRVSLVSRHIPIRDLAGYLTKDRIIRTVGDTYYALKKFFRIARPKIGVAGLNPHAGEEGLLGKEEKYVISPAVDHLRRKIVGITGPHPADTLFYKAYRGSLDAVVCMYHDQGLIPLKMVAFETGVNFTIGLPFIRTSPDHGTGFDIAGKGTANPFSMMEAIKLASGLPCPC